MPKIIKVDTIEQYCNLYGFKTYDPIVNIVEFSKSEQIKDYNLNWGFYALFLKNTKACRINYGRTPYDYDDLSVLAFAPGQVSAIERIPDKDPESLGLLFHPDFLFHTDLAKKMKRYTFFSYEASEALHLSEEERIVIHDCLVRIRTELQHSGDAFSKDLIIGNIGLLLDYCLRFYSRQFATRNEMNSNILTRFEQMLDEYLHDNVAYECGIPNVKYFAGKLCLSPNYFGDLLKRETGKTAQEYIQSRMISLAKERLLDSTYNINEVAYSLGFQYPQHFIRFFKKKIGCTPKEFRLQKL